MHLISQKFWGIGKVHLKHNTVHLLLPIYANDLKHTLTTKTPLKRSTASRNTF